MKIHDREMKKLKGILEKKEHEIEMLEGVWVNKEREWRRKID